MGRSVKRKGPFLDVGKMEEYGPLGCSSLAEGTRGTSFKPVLMEEFPIFLVVSREGDTLVVEDLFNPSLCAPDSCGSTPHRSSFNRGSTPPSSCIAWKPETATSLTKEGFHQY